MPAASPVLHVRCADRGSWVVTTDLSATPLSSHVDALGALHAARALAAHRGVSDILVHDRYHRSRPDRGVTLPPGA